MVLKKYQNNKFNWNPFDFLKVQELLFPDMSNGFSPSWPLHTEIRGQTSVQILVKIFFFYFLKFGLAN